MASYKGQDLKPRTGQPEQSKNRNLQSNNTYTEKTYLPDNIVKSKILKKNM